MTTHPIVQQLHNYTALQQAEDALKDIFLPRQPLFFFMTFENAREELNVWFEGPAGSLPDIHHQMTQHAHVNIPGPLVLATLSPKNEIMNHLCLQQRMTEFTAREAMRYVRVALNCLKRHSGGSIRLVEYQVRTADDRTRRKQLGSWDLQLASNYVTKWKKHHQRQTERRKIMRTLSLIRKREPLVYPELPENVTRIILDKV